MEKNEIKKALYKQKPIAELTLLRNGNAHYTTKLEDGTSIHFEISFEDMGTAEFFPTMDAKLLARWILIF